MTNQRKYSDKLLERLKRFKRKINYDGDYARVMKYGDKGKVGDGGYGKVYVVQRYDKKNQLFAMKKLVPDVDEIAVIKEIRILQKLHGHPNIIELVDICKSKETNRLSRLVFPFVNAYNYKSLFPTLNQETVQSLMVQLLNAVKYIHSKNIVHGDLKNRNLLIDKNFHLYVIDFGQAHRADINKKFSYHIGTLPYKPIEILLKSHYYDTKVDMWEVGRIFLELLVPRSRNYFKIDKDHKLAPEDEGQEMLEKWAAIFGTDAIIKVARKHNYAMPTFRKHRPEASIKSWLKWYVSHEESRSKSRSNDSHRYSRYKDFCTREALDLLNKLLQLDPDHRITAEEALKHPYFQDTHTETRKKKK